MQRACHRSGDQLLRLLAACIECVRGCIAFAIGAADFVASGIVGHAGCDICCIGAGKVAAQGIVDAVGLSQANLPKPAGLAPIDIGCVC